MHRTVITLGAAVLAMAAPAAAPAAQERPRPVGPIPVAAGQVEHTVTEAHFVSNGTKTWDNRIEQWVSRDAARTITRNRATGKVESDCTETLDEMRCWNADENTTTVIGSKPRGILQNSWAREGALIRQQVDMGWFVFGADTTFDGKPAKQLEDTPQAPSDTDSRHYVVADPESLFPLKRVVTGKAQTRDGVQEFTQEAVVTLREILAPADVDFTMSHPGATIRRIGDTDARAAKSRKAKRSRKAKAKRRRASAR